MPARWIISQFLRTCKQLELSWAEVEEDDRKKIQKALHRLDVVVQGPKREGLSELEDLV